MVHSRGPKERDGLGAARCRAAVPGRLGKAGAVGGGDRAEPVLDTVISVRSEEPLKASGSLWNFEPNGQGAACTLAVAPGRRFRADGADGAWALGCDGARTWQVFADRVVTGPAAPPPGDLGDLVDASWLLDADLELSGGTEVSVGGRRAYRVVARHREDTPPGTSWWERLFFPAVAVVDAETGLVLRLTRFKGGRPAMRQELRDLAALDAGADFGFTPPAGLPVHQAGSPPGESEPGSWAWSRDPAFWAWDPRR